MGLNMLRLVSTDEDQIEPLVAPEPEQEEVERASWTKRDWLALTLVTIVGAALRLVRLAPPDTLVFDETYYAKDACWYVNVSEAICDTGSEITQVHPPLGKWLIALGIRLFGYDSFGWRISAVVAGAIGIVLLYLLARKLFRSTTAATFSAGLFALDFLHFVQSRVAMLDIFAMTFGLASILFLVYDRERMLAPEPDEGESEDGDGGKDRDRVRSWRLAAGAAAGAAAACKWTGVFFLVIVVVATVAWEIGAARKKGLSTSNAVTRFIRHELPTVALWLVLVPMLVYGFMYIGRLEWSEGTWYKALWDRHKYMWDFHSNLESHHSYESPAWSWILLKRPVSYFFETDKSGDYKEIFATGNPFVWWPAVLALVYAAVRWIKDFNVAGPEGLIVGGFIMTYLAWIPIGLNGRSATFIFYLLPAVPFLCLALGYVASRIGSTWEAKAALSLFSAGVVALFVFYYPLLTQVAISQKEWDRRIWIFDNCDPGEGIETTTDVTQTVDKKITTFQTLTTTTESLPPPGWCWI